jgi:excisionase family DNA binding protein
MARPQPLRRLLDAQEVADLLHISRPNVYRLKDSGELACVRLGKRVCFQPKVIEQYLGEPIQMSLFDEGDTTDM